MKNKLITTLITFILITALLLTGCSNGNNVCEEAENNNSSVTEVSKDKNVQSLATYIEKGSYKDAIDVYNNSIYGNSNLESEAEEYIENYTKKINEDILSGEIDEKTAKSKISTVDKFVNGTDIYFANYTELSENIDKALASKIAYLSGVSLFESKNYIDAIAEFEKVIEDDSNYDDAISKKDEATEAYKSDLLTKYNDFAKNNDYISAVKLFEEAVTILPDDATVAANLNTCKKNHITKLLSDANTAFTDYTQYEKALAIIQSGLQYYPEDQSLLDKKEYYTQFAPQDLTKLTEYSKEYITVYNTKDDAKGNPHTNVIICASYGFYYDEGNIVYVLNKKYNKLQFNIFGLDTTSSELSSISIRDYSSGDYDTSKVLYINETVKQSALPFAVEVDVTGVDLLRVYCGRKVAIADTVLQRTAR